MTLTKTTTVPTGDADSILNLPILKMVVIVNDAAIVQTADDMSQLPPIIDRQVIWFPGGLSVAYQKQFQLPDLSKTLAFSLSPTNVVKDTIMQGETVDDIRVGIAYTKAGL